MAGHPLSPVRPAVGPTLPPTGGGCRVRHSYPCRILLPLLATLTFAPPAAAQPQGFKPPPPANQGTELFRGLFHFYGVKPNTNSHSQGSRETIVVIYGRPPGNAGWAAHLVKSTLEAGGSVLVATGWDVDNFHSWFPDGSARIFGGLVETHNPADGLGGNGGFPLVRDTAGLPGSKEGMVIAADDPSFLRLGVDRPTALRGFAAAYPGSVRQTTKPLKANEVFAAGGAGPDRNPFRCLVVANERVFSNRMLYASAVDYGGFTPDNFRFANETVKWLVADGRKECRFVENGVVVDRFDDFDYRMQPPPPGLPPDMPMPPIPNPLDRPVQAQIANFADTMIAKAEDANPLPDALSRNPRDYGYLLAAVVGVAVTVGLALAALRTWRARHVPDYLPPPADPHRLGPDATPGSFEHRRLEILRGGDFRGPVVAYIRRLFVARGLPEGFPGERMPAVDATGRNPRRLQGLVRDLWDEAFVFDHDPLPYTLWKEIEPVLAAARAAADAGLWQFRPAPSNVEDA